AVFSAYSAFFPFSVPASVGRWERSQLVFPSKRYASAFISVRLLGQTAPCSVYPFGSRYATANREKRMTSFVRKCILTYVSRLHTASRGHRSIRSKGGYGSVSPVPRSEWSIPGFGERY